MSRRGRVVPVLLGSLLIGAAAAIPAGATAPGGWAAPLTAVPGRVSAAPSAPPPAGSAEMLSDVGRFRWEKRLVFVFADGADAAAAVEALAAAAAGIEDRHVLWFVVRGDVVLTNHDGRLDPGLASTLRADYLPVAETPPVAVVLVGKDGGVKYRAGELDVNDLFREIDGMPMRQQEMRSNR